MAAAGRSIMARHVLDLIRCWQGLSRSIPSAVACAVYRHLWRLQRHGAFVDVDGKLSWISIVLRSCRTLGWIVAHCSAVDHSRRIAGHSGSDQRIGIERGV